jgi:exopolyphosphatase/guanosine-5'-triphosphate,3'-diphosphate pyrophosphatase
MKKLYAALDIGTQSVILSIGKIEEGKWTPKLEKVHPCRLGEGLGETGMISEAAEARLQKSLLFFRNVLWRLGADLVAIGGTEVFRKAENGEAVMGRASDIFGLPGVIYNGKQEAEGGYQALKYCYPEEHIAILDIGGGSTEVAYSVDSELKKYSYALGAAKLYEKYGSLPEPDNKKACVRGLRTVKSLKEQKQEVSLKVLGGTATTLAMMHQELEEYSLSQVEGLEMTRDNVIQWINRLADLNRNNRLRVVGLEESRVDLILPGLCILEEALAQLEVETFCISGWGFRHYILLKALQEKGVLSEAVT